jgi:uncharacterized protein YndB with AHSA1/START domain
MGAAPRLRVGVGVRIPAPAQQVWDALTDWERQGEWMVGTRVRATYLEGHAVGGRIEAWTGLGSVGFLDTMTVTEWDPPHRCVVQHTGRLVRGVGVFEVSARAEDHSLLTWVEDLDAPLGRFGAAGWPLVRPFAAWGLARSLRRFGRTVVRRRRSARVWRRAPDPHA